MVNQQSHLKITKTLKIKRFSMKAISCPALHKLVACAFLFFALSFHSAGSAESSCVSQTQMLAHIADGKVRGIGSFASVIRSIGRHKIVGVQLCNTGDRYYYAVKYWAINGKVVSLRIDAQSGVRF